MWAMQATMHGVLPVVAGKFSSLQSNAGTWSNKLTQAAAACNGLTMINKSTVAGDDLESGLFKTVEARFLVNVLLCMLSSEGHSLGSE